MTRFRSVIVVLALIASGLTLPASGAAASGTTQLLQEPVLTQSELIAWYRANVPSTLPMRAGSPSVSIEELVRIYYEEGAREGVAPDIAFIQALHETAWFNFPAGGCVRPTDHNYAGMGAYDCDKLNDDGLPWRVWRFATVQDGVRAQLQYLRAYADETVEVPGDLASALPQAREDRNFTNQWNWMVNTYRVEKGGPWPVLEQYGSGIWASDPKYVPKIQNYLDRVASFNGYATDAFQSRGWHLRHVNRGGGADSTGRFGSSSDEVLACDWNGDGSDTPGVYRGGRWIISNERNGAGPRTVVSFGKEGDLPLCGDWNGNGRDTLGIVRDGAWHLRNDLSGGNAHLSFSFGRVTRGDVPIVGDWNGNGRDTVGIIRDGDWHLRNGLSGGAGQIVFTYGRLTRGDLALVGDWNGNGRDGPGIVRDGEWHLRNSLSSGPGQTVFTYGRVAAGDVPVTGDWTGDGRDTPGIVR